MWTNEMRAPVVIFMPMEKCNNQSQEEHILSPNCASGSAGNGELLQL